MALMAPRQDLVNRDLGEAASQGLHASDDVGKVTSWLVLHGTQLRDRLAMAGDDYCLAALSRPEQAGQMGFGLIGSDVVIIFSILV
jgi:hypothetical protein